MPDFEIIEHPSDLKIRVFGKTKEELFLNALKGMAKLQSSAAEEETKTKRKIKIESFDPSTLLVDFLSQALYLSQINNEVYFSAKIKKLLDNQIEADLFGRKIERFTNDIKGVTYYDLNIKQEADGQWTVTLLFDI